MSPDPFFNPESNASFHLLAECQQICPASRVGGFCGARIHPDCLRIGSDGVVRVGLSVSAEALFAVLAKLGDVLNMARNPLGVLGQIGPAPELVDWRNQTLPRDAPGSFMPNLAEYASLCATRQSSPVGAIYGLEVCDASGYSFQRIVLTSLARRELFEEFVIRHQSPPEEAGHWFSPNQADSARRVRGMSNRIPALRSFANRASEQVNLLPRGFLRRLLTRIVRARIPLRTIHYSRGLIRSAVWSPDDFREGAGEFAGMEFVSGGDNGLHIHWPAVSTVWLWKGVCSCCARKHWIIEIGDQSDAIGLAITSGCNESESAWQALITGCLS